MSGPESFLSLPSLLLALWILALGKGIHDALERRRWAAAWKAIALPNDWTVNGEFPLLTVQAGSVRLEHFDHVGAKGHVSYEHVVSVELPEAASHVDLALRMPGFWPKFGRRPFNEVFRAHRGSERLVLPLDVQSDLLELHYGGYVVKLVDCCLTLRRRGLVRPDRVGDVVNAVTRVAQALAS